MTSSSWSLVLRQPSNHDELLMQQRLQFLENLSELKNLRKQLYSAAEYFETSYGANDGKEMVVQTLKDYAIKAAVNTVDHLGSVADKFNGFLDEKVDDMSETELRLCCMEQRISSCKVFTGKAGIDQPFLFIQTPKHHKRYVLADEDSQKSMPELHCRSFNSEADGQRFKEAIRARIQEIPASDTEKQLQIQRFRSMQGNFSLLRGRLDKIADQNLMMDFASSVTEKRAISTLRFPLLRSGSLLMRSTSPRKSRKQQQGPGVGKSNLIGNGGRELEQHTKKSKRMLMALLSMRRGTDGGVSNKLLEK